MLKKIKLKEAVGSRLGHDITEIRPGEFKGPALRKGHTVCDEDLCHLQRLGKNHLYVIDLAKDEIHENEAASILAGALAGEGVVWKATVCSKVFRFKVKGQKHTSSKVKKLASSQQ